MSPAKATPKRKKPESAVKRLEIELVESDATGEDEDFVPDPGECTNSLQTRCTVCHVVCPQITDLQRQIDAAYDRLVQGETEEMRREAERSELRAKIAEKLMLIEAQRATERSVTLSRPVRPVTPSVHM